MLILVTLFGLLIGSFLTACIHRVPLSRLNSWLEPEELEALPEHVKNQTLTITDPPRSLCPFCKKQLSWYENIPFFSWVFLRGRCSGCKTFIPIRYPLVELLTALSAYFSVHYYGLSATAALVFIWLCILIVITFIDYDYYIIPNLFTYPGMILGVLFGIIQTYYPITEEPFVFGIEDSLLGLLAGGGGLWFIAWSYFKIRKREGLGLGDVKLLGAIGAWSGIHGVVFTLFVGSVLGTVGGVLGLLLMKRDFGKPIPFGPYLAFAYALFLLDLY